MSQEHAEQNLMPLQKLKWKLQSKTMNTVVSSFACSWGIGFLSRKGLSFRKVYYKFHVFCY